MVELLLATGQVDVNAQVGPRDGGTGVGGHTRDDIPGVGLTPRCVRGTPQDNGGWTPIIWAAEHKHIEVIRRLLTRGADVTLTDNVSRDPPGPPQGVGDPRRPPRKNSRDPPEPPTVVWGPPKAILGDP